MSIEVIQPGFSTTVQDMGRYGYQKHGIIVGGAMDTVALRMANLLVGNQETEAVLEMTMKGPTLLFHDDLLIAISGGDLSVAIDGNPVSANRPVWVRKGSVLRFGHAQKGCRAYLAIAGGADVPMVLGSRSTNLRAAFGGLEGRPLQKGDRLPTKRAGPYSSHLIQLLASRAGNESFRQANWFIAEPHAIPFQHEPVVRVVRGEQFANFTPKSRHRFFDLPYKVTPQSDRMGYRFSGEKLELASPADIISAAVSAGTIQVPPNGQPIILMADRQTTGGYPVIGCVITADLPILAQCKPGEKLRFREASLQEAHQALFMQEKAFFILKQVLNLRVSWQ